MKAWLRRLLFLVATVLLLLTFVNASWLAPRPVGAVRLIAHRGVHQLFDHAGLERDSCTANRIEPPVHDYLENSARSMRAAARIGADMIEVDIAPTADGRIAIFHDWTVDCRTQGKGEVRSRTLAELQQLDIGYGYTADGGETYPLRGRGKDRIPSVEEAVAALPNTPILFHFKGSDPSEADLLAAALQAARRDVADRRDAFYGPPGPIERIKLHYPAALRFSKERIKACTREYMMFGWSGMVPDSCRNGVIMVPLNYQWAFWGWPNRMIQRMNSVGTTIIIIGPYGAEQPNGLTLPEQLGEIPSSFTGHVWVDDIWTIGPALRPARDFRSQAEIDAAEAGLARRRDASDN